MSFYADVIRKDLRFDSRSVCNDVNLLEPGTRAAVAQLLSMAHAAGKEIKLQETFRSQARQEYLFERHATQLRRVGCHNFGVACDFALFTGGKYDPTGEHYAFLTDLCKKVGLIAGANWGQPKIAHGFRDWDHVQRVPVFRQDEMFSGRWYPPSDYDPYADMKAHGVPGMD